MAISDRLAAADRGYEAGEAALTVASRARSSADAMRLLDILDLQDAVCRWDTTRVMMLTLERFRHGREFSANTLRGYLPDRALYLIGPALTWMQREHLICPTGRAVPSVSPGAKHRRVRSYALTLAGERASRQLAPIPGQDARPLDNLNRMTA